MRSCCGSGRRYCSCCAALPWSLPRVWMMVERVRTTSPAETGREVTRQRLSRRRQGAQRREAAGLFRTQRTEGAHDVEAHDELVVDDVRALRDAHRNALEHAARA